MIRKCMIQTLNSKTLYYYVNIICEDDNLEEILLFAMIGGGLKAEDIQRPVSSLKNVGTEN